MGSMVVTFPKRTSGIYNAQTTCAQPMEIGKTPCLFAVIYSTLLTQINVLFNGHITHVRK